MNTRNEHAIEIIKAESEGKTVQWRWKHTNLANSVWNDKPVKDDYTFVAKEYRIKPASAEYWVNIYSRDSVAVYTTKAQAEQWVITSAAMRVAVHMREVTDD